MLLERHYSSLFGAESYSIVYVENHLFFIEQANDACFGCFCVLASVNHGAGNTEVHVSFQITDSVCNEVYE